MNIDELYILDHFKSADKSDFGTSWMAFSDGVMGGLSENSSTIQVNLNPPQLQLSGHVSLENNGGFIQMALPLLHSRYLFDAAHFKGVYLRTRSSNPQPSAYAIHLRTRELSMPWQHYRHPIAAQQDWQELFLPFADFEARSTNHSLTLSRLTRIGLVASGREFQANLSVSAIGFYR